MFVFNKRIQKLLLLLVLCGLMNATVQGTETKWYSVEMVIFSHITPETRGDQWPVIQNLPDWSHAVTIQPGVAIPTPAQMNMSAYEREIPQAKPKIIKQTAPFSMLSQSNLRLNSIAESLQNSNGRFTTLLHLAWRQPGQPKKIAQPIYLQSIEMSANELPKLQGTVRLSVQRYLHLDLDIILQRKALNRVNDDGFIQSDRFGSEITGFRFKAHRRMRSKELHYLDHPKLGAIVFVQPS